jgi:hypothetical protein
MATPTARPTSSTAPGGCWQASAGSAVPRLAALARQQPPGAVLLVGLAVGVAIVSWLVAAFVSRLGRRTAG